MRALAVACCLFAGFSAGLSADDLPVNALRDAAKKIQAKFDEASRDPAFGRGLAPTLVTKIKSDSMDFWSMVQGIDDAQIEEMDEEDGA